MEQAQVRTVDPETDRELIDKSRQCPLYARAVYTFLSFILALAPERELKRILFLSK